MLNLQKLQNLAQMQHPSLPSLAGLQGLAGLTSAASTLNSPLNLSVGSGTPIQGAPGSQMPQFILASGQLVQGIQGAQLLIPTPQGKTNLMKKIFLFFFNIFFLFLGISTQTILTIPMTQQLNSNEQLVQSLAALTNGTSNLNNIPLQQNNFHGAANLGNAAGLLSPHLLSSSVQQLLAAIQPQIFPQQNQQSQQPTQQQTQQQSSQQNQPTMPIHQTSPALHPRVQTPKSSPPRITSSLHERHHPYEKPPTTTATSTLHSSHTQPPHYSHTSNGHGHLSSSPLHMGGGGGNSGRGHSPTSVALNNINR